MPFHRLNSVGITWGTPPCDHTAWDKFRKIQSDNPEDIIFRFIWIRLEPVGHPGLTSQHGFFAVRGDYDMSHDFFYTIWRDCRSCDWDPKFVEQHFETIINEDDDCYDIEYTHSIGYKALFTFADADRVQQFRDWLQCQLAAFIPMTPKNAAA